jgi:gluconokinase
MPKRRPEFLVLSVDIGTSSTRAALFDDAGHRLDGTLTSQHYRVVYGSDGRAELSPATVARAVTHTRNKTLRSHRSLAAAKRIPVVALAGSALWHGLLGLDDKFRPVTPIFTWADSRAKDDAARLRKEFSEEEIQQRTGCVLRSTFWPAKLSWLSRTQPKLFRQVKHWVSPSDWVFYTLFGELGCSASMASATGLYDLQKGCWMEDLSEAVGIDTAKLPAIAERLGLDRPTSPSQTVFCPIGDGAAGNLGSDADRPGLAAINIGTSAAVRVVQKRSDADESRLPFGLFRYVIDADELIAGGAVSNAGNLRQWCLRELHLPKTPAALERILARKLAAADSLTVLPFWVEERAPTWPEGQRGLIEGLTQATTAAEILRATETAVFYRLAQIFEAIESGTGPVQNVIVSGGILHSRASLKLLADAFGRDLEISTEMEASLRGAAVYALRKLGKKISSSRSNKTVRCDRALAAKHQKKRQRQIELEKILRS